MPIGGARIAGANDGTIIAPIIRRTDKHAQLSFRPQVRRHAPSSESSMGISTHTLESQENVTLTPGHEVILATDSSVKASKKTRIAN
jgi:hypothetical protein